MSEAPVITVLCGSASEEAEVSRVSGAAIAKTLGEHFKVQLVDLPANYLPETLTPDKTVIFPALHGTFGEDGQLQRILEERGFAYAGCDAAASALCMNKVNTKAVVAESGFDFAKDITFHAPTPPEASDMIELLGEHMVLKPMDKGSSVGLHIIDNASQLERVLGELQPGAWMLESFTVGREMTIGLLNGKAMGIVEVCPVGGVYDFQHKYTAGATNYKFPAELDESIAERVRAAAEKAFVQCGCRDFARLDFILTEDERICFLEINTIPGLTPTSLLPKSASCLGMDFSTLALRMVAPAIERFHQEHTLRHA